MLRQQTIDTIKFHVRCCIRAGRSLAYTWHEIRGSYGATDAVQRIVAEHWADQTDRDPSEVLESLSWGPIFSEDLDLWQEMRQHARYEE